MTLFLLHQEHKENFPDGFQYSRFCQLYREWAGKIDLVMRQEHRAGEKVYVDYSGQTLPIRYQLLHRTASALLTARDFHAASAVMLIQCFGGKPNLQTDFDVFYKALGAQQLSFGVWGVPAFSKPRLFLVWCGGNRAFLDVELPNLF